MSDQQSTFALFSLQILNNLRDTRSRMIWKRFIHDVSGVASSDSKFKVRSRFKKKLTHNFSF